MKDKIENIITLSNFAASSIFMHVQLSECTQPFHIFHIRKLKGFFKIFRTFSLFMQTVFDTETSQ